MTHGWSHTPEWRQQPIHFIVSSSTWFGMPPTCLAHSIMCNFHGCNWELENERHSIGVQSFQTELWLPHLAFVCFCVCTSPVVRECCVGGAMNGQRRVFSHTHTVIALGCRVPSTLLHVCGAAERKRQRKWEKRRWVFWVYPQDSFLFLPWFLEIAYTEYVCLSLSRPSFTLHPCLSHSA